ncbi:TPA: UDP-Gal betaGal beta 1,3-galactosyltransferase, polypeptide 6 [Trebouxia sp. C0006]
MVSSGPNLNMNSNETSGVSVGTRCLDNVHATRPPQRLSISPSIRRYLVPTSTIMVMILLSTVILHSEHRAWQPQTQDKSFPEKIGDARHVRFKSSYIDNRLSARSARSYSQLPYVTVVVMVTSAASWLDRRERIRTQFPRNVQLVPSVEEQSAMLRFAIGTQGVSTEVLGSVRAEAGNSSDVLFFDCLDEDDELKHPNLWRRDAGPSSTTNKVMLSVQWAVRHFDFEYFFRLGDDSYFRVDKFLAMLLSKEIPSRNAVVGHIMTDRVYGMEQIYPQGMGYGLTYDVCVFIASNTAVLLNTAPEDCVVARWLFAIGADFIDSPLWRDIHMGDSCHTNMVLAHKLPPELWLTIVADGTVSC